MTNDDSAFATIEELAPRIAAGDVSPVELTEALLARIAEADGRLKSYATVMADSALAEARQAEAEIAAGEYRGPLHGVPIAVKDLCYTDGVRTMGGTKVLEDFVPDFDSTVVARFRAAGAVLLGKLNLTEGAMAGYNRARQSTRGRPTAGRVCRRAARAWRRRRGSATRRWAATRAGRSARRRRRAGSSG